MSICIVENGIIRWMVNNPTSREENIVLEHKTLISLYTEYILWLGIHYRDFGISKIDIDRHTKKSDEINYKKKKKLLFVEKGREIWNNYFNERKNGVKFNCSF